MIISVFQIDGVWILFWRELMVVPSTILGSQGGGGRVHMVKIAVKVPLERTLFSRVFRSKDVSFLYERFNTVEYNSK